MGHRCEREIRESMVLMAIILLSIYGVAEQIPVGKQGALSEN